MRVQLTRETTGDRAVREAVTLSVVANVVEIAAAVVLTFLVMALLRGGVEETIARMTAIVCMGVVTWGAVTDLGKTFETVSTIRREQALEEAFAQLESLNREMRAQRHDFMNHIQVIYSLIEMEEPQEALRYMDRIYGDMQHVSKMLRTDSPAVNALIQAKSQEAEKRGIEFSLSIHAKWGDASMPAWELCRVLGNLIDNAMDAATSETKQKTYRPQVELMLGEDENNWFFSVRNNGPEIPENIQEHLFEAGFTTKSNGHGMGLYNVNRIISEMGGRIALVSNKEGTVFSGYVPRSQLRLTEGQTGETS